MIFKKIKNDIKLIELAERIFKKKYFIYLLNYNIISYLAINIINKNNIYIKKENNIKDFFYFEKFIKKKYKKKFGILNFNLFYLLYYNNNNNNNKTSILFFEYDILFIKNNITNEIIICIDFKLKKALKIIKKIIKILNIKDRSKYIENLNISINKIKPDFLDYIRLFKRIKKKIFNGKIMQLQLSRKITFNINKKTSLLSIYKKLLSKNSSSLFFYTKRLLLFSFSPEYLVIGNNNNIKTSPIAGTINRGINIVCDKILEKRLINDKKELSEHLMLIDLSRNDLNSINLNNTIWVNEIFKINKFNYIQHITSKIYCYFRNKFYIKIIRQMNPAGTLSGTPKIEALNLLYRYEKYRNIFGGNFGILSYNKIFLMISIRILVYKSIYNFYTQSASGIVKSSCFLYEWNELNNKLNFFKYDIINR